MKRVLVLSRSYPNSQMELLGLWVEGLVRASQRFCRPTVISPVPYCPPLPGLPNGYTKFRAIEHRRVDSGVEVLHPRFLSGPGYALFYFEWMLYYAGVARLVRRLHRHKPFHLIHAHFTYPDGVVAARLGKRLGIPVVITEHAPWDGWMEKHPRVTRRAARAVRQSAFHISVSESVRRSVARDAGDAGNLVVVPNGVDSAVFTTQGGERRIPNQILFAGAVRPVKGVDILLQAMRLLADQTRDVNLVIAGEAFYGAYQKEEVRLKRMVEDLRLQDRVRFLGKKSPTELASLMRQSAALILPSRAESFGMVLVEALACGTPVVATRCGGPEDIVSAETGVLVPPEDAPALAGGIVHVLEHAPDYEPCRLRKYAVERFGWERVGAMVETLYARALDNSRA